MVEKMPEAKKTRADEISFEVAGRLIMVGPERVRQLIKAGFIERTRPGYTTIPSAVQGYIKFLKEAASEKTANASVSRVQDARAKEIERRLAREERDLIQLDEATLALSMLAGAVAQELAGLGARITRDMALRQKIEAEVHGAQTRIAKALEKLSGFVASGGEPPEAIR